MVATSGAAVPSVCSEPCEAPCTRVDYYHSAPEQRTTRVSYCMLPCEADQRCPAAMHCEPFARTQPLAEANPPIKDWYRSVDREAMCVHDR